MPVVPAPILPFDKDEFEKNLFKKKDQKPELPEAKPSSGGCTVCGHPTARCLDAMKCQHYIVIH